jgi:phosphoglycolate phosphatase
LKKYKLIIFDWDGTIVDSFQKIIFCVQNAAQSIELPIPKDKDIRDIIGLSFHSAWPTLFPNNHISHLDDFLNYYRDYFYKESDDSTLFMPVKKLLDDLQDRDYLLAVATGKGRRGLDHEIAKHNLAKYFIITKTTSECFSKPNPQMVHEILEFTGIDARDAIVIGDSIYDIQMAFNAEVDSIHITDETAPNYEAVTENIIHRVRCISEIKNILC